MILGAAVSIWRTLNLNRSGLSSPVEVQSPSSGAHPGRVQKFGGQRPSSGVTGGTLDARPVLIHGGDVLQGVGAVVSAFLAQEQGCMGPERRTVQGLFI